MSRQRSASFRIWNKKIHYYGGLYFLLFIWLFALSGLLLNHEWSFADFWPQRRETTRTLEVAVPAARGDMAIARALMRQAQVAGEVQQIKRSPDGAKFELQVGRPGRNVNIDVDLIAGQATVKHTELNGWGVFKTLHTFSGVKLDDPSRRPDWLLTRIWSLAIDALSIGLILLVATGLYLWLRLKSKRALGLTALGLGLAVCGLFAKGLSLLM
jgi:hypothetical protein